MPKIRIIFEKRGLFTFVNHMDLPTVFSRSARRAGLVQELTQGFSPRPKISLASPLAVGVEGLCEPADFWFENWEENYCRRWNEALPEGLKILKWKEAEKEPALAKTATAALYRFEGESAPLTDAAETVLKEAAFGINALLSSSFCDGAVHVAVCDLERCGAGFLVKALASRGVISGWRDVFITRLTVGVWDAQKRSVLSVV